MIEFTQVGYIITVIGLISFGYFLAILVTDNKKNRRK